MAIKLKWDAVTTQGASILVYRALVPITYDNIPTALATLAGSAVEYSDASATIYVPYYYSIGVKVGDEISLTPVGWVIDMPSNGPGGKTVLCGDAHRGFMGKLTTTEFIAPQVLLDACGISAATVNTATTNFWMKFVHDGKIKYIYTAHIAVGNGTAGTGVSWNALYNAGMVYGINGPGTVPSDLTAVNQNKTIVIGANSYRVRLARYNSTANYDAQVDTNPESEWHACVRAMYNSSTGTTYEALSDFPISGIFNTSNNTMLAEISGNYCAGALVAGSSQAVYSVASTKLRSATVQYWRPVLELIV